MSRTAVLGSNALATAVQFYAAALDEATRRADQAEALLKQAMHPRAKTREDEFINLVGCVLDDAALSSLEKVSSIEDALNHLHGHGSTSGSPTIDRNLVSSDDAPRGGEVRDSVVPR